MKRSVIALGPYLGAFAAIATQARTSSAQAVDHVLILLDASGSMTATTNCTNPTLPGVQRWVCGVQQATKKRNDADTQQLRKYFVWRFRNSAADRAQYVDTGTVKSCSVNANCSGSTCDVATHTCVPKACTTNVECGTGSLCNAAQVCVPRTCAADADCGASSFCVTGMCTGAPMDFAGAGTELSGQLVRGPDASDTPLAGAYCQAVQFLGKFKASNAAQVAGVQTLVESDGEENETPAGDQCKGIESLGAFAGNVVPTFADVAGVTNATVNNLSLNPDPSWQALMLDVGISGFTHKPYNPLNPAAFLPGVSGPVVTNITFITDPFVPLSLAAAPSPAAPALPATVDPVVPRPVAITALTPSAVAPAFSDPLIAFFDGLSRSTGGRLVVATAENDPDDPLSVPAITGDADQSGCVDGADFDILSEFFGKPLDAAQPETFAADLNADGTIDDSDYHVLQRNFETGCAASPGAVPLLAPVFFGLADLAAWTSTSPLRLLTSPRTQGVFALQVGGTGKRVIRSSTFDAELFKAVTEVQPPRRWYHDEPSKLTFDIFIPAEAQNRRRLGDVEIFAQSPSGGVFHVSLGKISLNHRPLGTFSTLEFELPERVKRAILASRDDFTLQIVLDSRDTGHVLDNVRFLR